MEETENLLADPEAQEEEEERQGPFTADWWTVGEFRFFGYMCIVVEVFGFIFFRTFVAPHFTTYNVVLNDHCSNVVAAICPRANISCSRMCP